MNPVCTQCGSEDRCEPFNIKGLIDVPVCYECRRDWFLQAITREPDDPEVMAQPLVRAAVLRERERCAKIADSIEDSMAEAIAARIRSGQ